MGSFGRTAFVLTVSDGVTAGVREDGSGDAVEARLTGLRFVVERGLVPDDQVAIEGAIRDAAARHPLVVTTGGTGLTPRDVTPQATQVTIDYEVPGLAEAMRAAGRAVTPLADLSRGCRRRGRAVARREPAGKSEGRHRIARRHHTGPGPRARDPCRAARPRGGRMTLVQPFDEVAAYLLVFPLFWGAAIFFCLVMARHLRVFAVARTPGPNPFADVRVRFTGLIHYAFLQTKMFKDARAGVMHAGIFWGFVLLTIGTANIVTGGLIQMVLSVPLDGLLWTAICAMQNVVAVIVLVSIGWAFVRRLVTKPKRLTYNRDALLILSMIGGVVATELFAQVFEAAAYGDVSGAFVANTLAVPLRATLSTAALEAAFTVLWWSHMFLVAAFLCYLPFSKHLHIATSFPNIWFRKLKPRGELPMLDLEADDARFGLRTLQDLGWKDLLDGFTCTECGRCQEACPAWNTGKPLNPKELIMGIRHMSVDAEHGIDIIPNSPIVRDVYGLDDTTPDAAALAAPIVDNAIPYDAVWDCVTCGACVEACPVLIEHVDKIVGLRRNLVLEDSRFPQELTGAFRAMENQGNPWGQPASARLDWAKPLPFEVETVAAVSAAGQLDELEVLYWVGCAAAFDPRQPEGRSRRRDVPARRRCPVRDPRPGGVVYGRPGPPDGQRLRLPDPGSGERGDPRSVSDGRADHRHGLPALLQHDRQRVRPTGRGLPDRPPLDLSRGAAGVRSPPDAARRRDRGDRGSSARERDGPRLVLPGPLQRGHRGSPGRAWCRGRVGHGDGQVGQEHVLLRRRWRSDVDGGGSRHPDQRGTDASGARDRRRDGRHVLPVLHGDDG